MNTAAAGRLRADSLAEDVFGLNARGLRTIWATIVRPRDVFGAARDPHWRNRYTPSVRLVFFLYGLMQFLRAVLAPEDGAMVGNVAAQLLAADPSLDEGAARAAASRYLVASFAVLPFVWTGGQALLALVTRVWGRGVSAVLRVRLHLLALVPGTAFGLLTFGVVPLLPASGAGFGVFSFVSYVGMMLIDLVTAFRGGVAGGTAGRRVAKSALFVAVVHGIGLTLVLGASALIVLLLPVDQ